MKKPLKKIKVYGWTAMIREAERKKLGTPEWVRQCRCIIGARSLREVREIVGHRDLFNLCETGNAREIEIGSAQPYRCFVAPLDGPRWHTYIEVPTDAVS